MGQERKLLGQLEYLMGTEESHRIEVIYFHLIHLIHPFLSKMMKCLSKTQHVPVLGPSSENTHEMICSVSLRSVQSSGRGS